MLRVVVLRVLFFVGYEVALYSVSLICIVWCCFSVIDADQYDTLS